MKADSSGLIVVPPIVVLSLFEREDSMKDARFFTSDRDVDCVMRMCVLFCCSYSLAFVSVSIGCVSGVIPSEERRLVRSKMSLARVFTIWRYSLIES